MRIVPAGLAFDESGTPFSPVYGDVYHSTDSGPGQARHVFVAGNDLPLRWAGERVYTILETGFGLGLNFLATWREWRADPARPERLHFVSIEKHPLDRDAFETAHLRYGELAPLAAALLAACPPLLPGVHRLHFEGERVTLTLAFGDVTALLPRLRLCADAIYLDGFAPDRNPDMWSPQVMKALGRLSHAGTTVATWSTAAVVRQGLADAGFTVEKRPGFGRKREMLVGRFEPRWTVRRGRTLRTGAPLDPHFRRVRPRRTAEHAIVVGAGLAGAAACERLAARGWRIDLIERSSETPPSRARFAGIFHPHLSPDDCILSRAVRSGYLYALARWRALELAGHPLEWARCGALQLDEVVALASRPQENKAAGEDACAAYPAEYAEHVDRARASSLSGAPVESGGWWFPGAGWMRPSSLVAAQLAAAAPSLTTHFGTNVDAIVREDGEWRALAADGTLIAAAPVLILANSSDVTRLASVGQALNRVRGQVTYIPIDKIAAPRTIVTKSGYVLPVMDGTVITGSTYDRDDNPEPQVHGHEANLLRLSHVLPGALGVIDASQLDGAVGFRAVAPDRLPLIGAMPDVAGARNRKADLTGAHLRDLPRCEGLYCISGFASRGLIWAALAGEIIGSLLEGEPLPLESDLADAMDPARFVLRQARTGRL